MEQPKSTPKKTTTKKPAKKKVVPHVVGMTVPLPKKIKITIPEFKDRLKFLEGAIKYTTPENIEQIDRYKQFLKNLYLDILSKHSSDIKDDQLQIAYRRADDWENIAVTRAVSNVKDLLKAAGETPGNGEPADHKIKNIIYDSFSNCYLDKQATKKAEKVFPFFLKLIDANVIVAENGISEKPFTIIKTKGQYKIYEIWRHYLKKSGIKISDVFMHFENSPDTKSLSGNYQSEKNRLNSGKDFLTDEEKKLFLQLG